MHSQGRAFLQPTRANIHQYQFNNPIVRALQSTQSLPEHITITWFFAAVEAEAPVLSCVVMGTSDPVKNTAIGTLEYDWSIKIVHKLCRKQDTCILI